MKNNERLPRQARDKRAELCVCRAEGSGVNFVLSHLLPSGYNIAPRPLIVKKVLYVFETLAFVQSPSWQMVAFHSKNIEFKKDRRCVAFSLFLTVCIALVLPASWIPVAPDAVAEDRARAEQPAADACGNIYLIQSI